MADKHMIAAGKLKGTKIVSTPGVRRADGRCSGCGASGFTYGDWQIKVTVFRGYRCNTCGTVKPGGES